MLRAFTGRPAGSAWLEAPVGRILFACDIVFVTYETLSLAMQQSLILSGLIAPRRRMPLPTDDDDEDAENDAADDQDDPMDVDDPDPVSEVGHASNADGTDEHPAVSMRLPVDDP